MSDEAGPDQRGNRYPTDEPVVVKIGDAVASWSLGDFAGDEDLVSNALFAASVGEQVPLLGATVTATSEDPVGAFAALVSSHPGRYVLTSAPDEVYDMLERGSCQESADGWVSR